MCRRRALTPYGNVRFRQDDTLKRIFERLENARIHINPNRSLGLVVFRNFRRMNFVCILMSDSELLRIKKKQKASYKSRKTARSNTENPYTA